MRLPQKSGHLHLRENTSGVGYATYDKLTLLPLEKGQIPFEHLPPDGRNAIPAARNWFLFELSDDPRKAIQLESIRILDNIPDSGIRKRRVWDDPSIPTDDVRLIDSNYKDLYRVPNGGVIQMDYSDGSSYTARVEHLDEYHFDLGGLYNTFHICQFAEIMERNGTSYYPEIQTQDEQGAYTPSIDLFVEIAAFFDVTLDHLIMGKALSDHEEHLRNKLHQKRLANQKLSLKLQRVAQNLAAIAEEL